MYLKKKLHNLRIKFFLWLIGKENHDMWVELTKRYVENMKHCNYAMIGKHCDLAHGSNMVPCITYMEDYSRIQGNVSFVSTKGKLFIKKYAAIGTGCIIIPGNHVPTVGVPQFLSGRLHINDVDHDLVIGEDAWVGAGAILLSHCKIGRGAVIAAGAVVSKPVPPYAVVAGVPAKIIATRFSIEQIVEHEKQLYPKEERMDCEELKRLFAETYQGKRAIGKSTMSEEDKKRLDAEKAKIGIPIYTS